MAFYDLTYSGTLTQYMYTVTAMKIKMKMKCDKVLGQEDDEVEGELLDKEAEREAEKGKGHSSSNLES